MAFDKTFIETVRDRVSIVDLISKTVPLTRKSKEYWGCCPFHHEKTASFSVSEEKNFYHCFGCGAHGDVITFVMQTQHLSFIEAIEKLCHDAGIPIPAATEEQRRKDKESHALYEVFELATNFYIEQLYSENGKAGLDYLKSRQLSDDMITNFRLCYAPAGRDNLVQYLKSKGVPLKVMLDAGLARISEKTRAPYDYFRERVLFPITDTRGRIIGFGGRIMVKDDNLPKYLNSPESFIFSKGRNLYGLAQARVQAIENRKVIATEGYMDCITLHQFGFKYAVAPLGTALTEQQIELLWKLAPEPTLCFDSDTAGRNAGIRAALRVLPILKPGYSLRFCLLEGAKDPDEFLHAFGHDKFQEVLDNKCISLSDILWMYFTNNRIVETPEQRAGLEQDIQKELSRIKSESIRKFYNDEFNSRMKKQFYKIVATKKVSIPKANPENLNEKMILAFAITYPSLFAKFLESGKIIELSHPVYKKIFEEVKKEVVLSPYTKDTMLSCLNGKGYNPQILLKFEIDALSKHPEDAMKILDEKILKLQLENLQDELKSLTSQIFNVPADEVSKMQSKIQSVKDEIQEINLKLSEV